MSILAITIRRGVLVYVLLLGTPRHAQPVRPASAWETVPNDLPAIMVKAIGNGRVDDSASI